MGWRLDIEMPLNGRCVKAHIKVRDDNGKIMATYFDDLRSHEGRRRVARALAEKVGQDTGKIERQLEEAWAEALNFHEQSANSPEPTPEPMVRYSDDFGYLCWLRTTAHGELTIPLANFTARIVEERIYDDGVECTTVLAIEGKHDDGRPLPRTEVPADRFPGLHWVVDAWGTRAVVYAGQGIRDHLRAALQLLSSDVMRRIVFTHTGWRKVGEDWLYLHAGGAIGPNGLAPDIGLSLPSALERFELPEPPTGQSLCSAVQASLGMLTALAPDRIVYPLLAAVYRAILGDCDFSGNVTGPSGHFKSELAALCQQHFGPRMDRLHLPGNWNSTANALEAMAFAAKDALFVVDDFAPGGSSTDVQRFHREADRLLRAQGNHAGRHRMRADGSLRVDKPPRGLILTTGEEVPRGQSLRARQAILEVGPFDVDKARLSACQRDAAVGLYAQAMAGFIVWLAPQFAAVRERLPTEIKELRDKASIGGQHARTPEIVANLAIGLRYLLAFAIDAKAITKAEGDQLRERGWKGFGETAAAQADHQEAAEPTRQFLRLLTAALSSGRAHVAGPDGNEPRDRSEAWGWRNDASGHKVPQGRRIGWVSGIDLYLEPEAAFAEAQELAAAQKESLPVSPQTMRRRLKERGLLASTEKGKLTTRRTLEGSERPVLHLHATCLVAQKSGEPGESGEYTENQRQNPPILSPGLNGFHQEPGDRTGQKPADKTTVSPESPESPCF